MNKLVWQVGIALVVCALIGPVVAQSDETPRQTIRVLDAIYGQDQRICSVYDDIARQCDGREYCEITVDNALCRNQDPYRNVAKQLFVGWDCGDGRRSLTVDQQRTARIYCWNGAEQGRQPIDTVWRRSGEPVEAPAPLPPPSNDYTPDQITVTVVRYGAFQSYCDATEAFARDCNSRSSCSVRVDNDLCGDPREGAKKRAYITYQCNGEDVQKTAAERATANLSCPDR